MSFYSTYDLVDLVRDDGIKSFNAREIATGRMVLVHLFTRPEAPEMQALLSKVAKLPAEARGQILMQGVHEGTPYVVTALITAYPGFREWLLSQRTPAEPAGPPPVQARPTNAAPVPEDDPFASLFKKPGTPQPSPSATQATRTPVRPATEDFRHLIETPTSKKKALKPPRPDGSETQSNTIVNPVGDSGPGEFTRLFQSPAASGPPPPPPPAAAAPHHEPGEFTRLFQTSGSAAASPQPAPVQPPPAQPAQQPGEFTRTFGALSQSPAPPPPPAYQPAPAAPGQEIGEFTRTFGALSDPPKPPQQAPPRSSAPPNQEIGEFTRTFGTPSQPTQPAQPPPPPAPAQQAGEFTRLFQTGDLKSADQIPTKLAPSSPSAAQQQQPGEFTRTFGAMSPQPPPAPGGPAPSQETGEFTRLFQAGAKPAEPIPAQRSQAAPPSAPGPDAGEFTRLFHTGSTASGPGPSQTPPSSSSAPSKEPGDLTRMFQTAKQPPPPSQPAGEFTRMFSSPPPQGPPQTPSSPSTPSQGGEFTRMFTNPSSGQPQRPSSPPVSPKSDEPGEFTRMFDSPLRPNALGPSSQGPADPFAGRSSSITPPQATPVGEFTSMFGKGGVTPQQPPKGPPTPRTAAESGATSVFKAPQPSGYNYTPSQSAGQSDFTTMMSRPTKGILADAASTPAVEKKNFFKTYLPLILFGALLLVIVIAVIIFLAMRKH